MWGLVGTVEAWRLGASYSKRIQSGVPVRGVYSICAVFLTANSQAKLSFRQPNSQAKFSFRHLLQPDLPDDAGVHRRGLGCYV